MLVPQEYKAIGTVVGRFYNEAGQPSAELLRILSAKAPLKPLSQKPIPDTKPCGIRWSPEESKPFQDNQQYQKLALAWQNELSMYLLVCLMMTNLPLHQLEPASSELTANCLCHGGAETVTCSDGTYPRDTGDRGLRGCACFSSTMFAPDRKLFGECEPAASVCTMPAKS